MQQEQMGNPNYFKIEIYFELPQTKCYYLATCSNHFKCIFYDMKITHNIWLLHATKQTIVGSVRNVREQIKKA